MSIVAIVGLGNPGAEYENTRHNLGFRLVDELASQLGLQWTDESYFEAKVAKGVWNDQTLMLIKPQTFMNESGRSLVKFCKYYKWKPAQLIVAYDDITLPLCRIKISEQGGTAGHNGIADLIDHLGDGFLRFRVGIGGKTHPEMDLKDHVLGRFSKEEQATFDASLAQLINGLRTLVDQGVVNAMNLINQK